MPVLEGEKRARKFFDFFGSGHQKRNANTRKIAQKRKDPTKSRACLKGSKHLRLMRKLKSAFLWCRYVMFQQFAALNSSKFDGYATFDAANDTCMHLAERDGVAHLRHDVRGDGRAGQGYVYDAADMFRAVRQDHLRHRVFGHEAVVAAVFGKIEFVPVRKPRQNIGDLVAFADRIAQFNRKATIDQAGNPAFDAAQVVKIAITRSPTLPVTGVIMAMPPGDMSIT